jgi:Flp pilus assembly pilin Flp
MAPGGTPQFMFAFSGFIMVKTVRALRDDTTAATAVEYALMVAFIALAIIGAVIAFGQKVMTMFANLSLHNALQ